MGLVNIQRLFLILLVLFGLLIALNGGWDNFKLKTVPYWAYFTIENNPLLKGKDADLSMVARAEVKSSRIDLSDLLPGGPPKDGIPAIDNPQFDTKDTTPFSMDEIILGVFINGEAKAYPYGILNWHEIVNDVVGGVPVSISYCPLCDTGITFERVVNGQVTTFGVSGKLYQSCLVMYDRLTDSLWSQPWGTGIFGEETNTILKRFPSYKTTLGKWIKKYPDTKIISTDTGHSRNYFRYPYGTYYTNNSLIFPVRNLAMVRSNIKDIVYIAWIPGNKTPFNRFDGLSHAFPLNELKKKGFLNGRLGKKPIVAILDSKIDAVRAFEVPAKIKGLKGEKAIFLDGREETFDSMKEVPITSSFAFVYPAFFK